MDNSIISIRTVASIMFARKEMKEIIRIITSNPRLIYLPDDDLPF